MSQVVALAPPITTVYRPAEPVELLATVGTHRRGAADPAFQVEGAAVWIALRTPHGTATLHLTEADGIRATAWGEGAEWAIAGVPQLLGADDDWSACELSRHPLLAEVRRRRPGLRLSRSGRVFDAVIAAVFEQKVTTLEARRSWRVLVAKHGSPAPGPAPAGLTVPPSPTGWKRIPSWEWHRAGVTPQRSDTAMRCAARGDSLERALDHPDPETALRSVPGIGVWTAAEALQRSHGHPDAVSVGDYHLPKIVGHVLAGHPVDDDGMLELLEPWRGHRQRIMRLVLASGLAPARRAPRLTIPEHRHR